MERGKTDIAQFHAIIIFSCVLTSVALEHFYLISMIFCRLLGKVAADNSHRWVYSDIQNGCEPNYIGSWNASIDHVREVAD